jgi:hypothetical protein
VVVKIDLSPWADIEDTLCEYLSVVAPTDTVVPAEKVEGIEIVRVGGPDDGITDYPRVQVTCYANTRDRVKIMAEEVRQLMQNDVIRRAPIEFDADGLHWEVQVDRVDSDTPPENVGYKNPGRRAKPAFYRLGLRRPRTTPLKG